MTRTNRITGYAILAVLPLLTGAFWVRATRSSRRSHSFQQQSTSRPELVLQRGHSLGVTCATFSPDGSWFASGSADNSIIIWQVSSGRELRTFTGHSGYVRALAASQNGKWLASGGNDQTVKVWDVATGREVFAFKTNHASIATVVFSPDSKLLAAGDTDETIRVWNLTTGNESAVLTKHQAPLTALTFSPSGKTLAAAANREVILWNTNDWQELPKPPRINGNVTAIAFSHDSNKLACSTVDGTVLVFTVGSERQRFALKNDSSKTLALGFGSDNSLISVHANGAIDKWDSPTGKILTSSPGDSNAEQMIFATISPDMTAFVAGNGSRDINLHGVGNSATLTFSSHSTGINSVAFSDDGHWFASANNDASIRLWQVATGRELPRLLGHSGYVTSVSFSPDSRMLASGSRSGEILVWDVAAARLAYRLPSRSAQGINRVAFSPDGKLLAAAGMNQQLEIWDLERKQSKSLVGHTAEITSVVFTADGKLLISGGRDKSIRIWDAGNGSIVESLDNADAEVNCLALSPDGRLLVAGNADKSIHVFDLAQKVVAKTLMGHTSEVLAVAFSPDGQTFASASADHTVVLWDRNSGGNLHQLRGTSESVTGVVFSKDGRWILSASDDGTIIVWSSSGIRMATIVSVSNSNDWLVATPDGLFDGSPESWSLLLWRFGGDTFNALPVEAYFSEFFYPGLLADIFSGNDPKPTQDIVQKDRRQPTVKILSRAAGPNTQATRTIEIELEISAALPDKNHATTSGARDVRLFRNGLLVKTWPGDFLHEAQTQTIRTNVPIVSGENKFSAYAFNNDNIKSVDASLLVRGADSLKRQGTAYLLVIGVEQYENPQYNLKYPVADASEMGDQIKAQQERLGRYNPVVTIPLMNAEATKKNILLALALLAGTESRPPDTPGSLSRIRPVQPEDAVLIYFSGHGTAIRDHFYVIPHDLGYKGDRDQLDLSGLAAILSHSVSDEELEQALQPLDADQLLLVIDACNSGQAVEAEEKRRGPMNTRGLAQLAYEKGIYILTASQSVEVAFEAAALKHSYLAYALLEEGIKTGAADENGDGNIYLNEWFDYANERVPQIRRQRYQQRKELVEEEADDQKVQRPRVFYTRESGAKHFLVARR